MKKQHFAEITNPKNPFKKIGFLFDMYAVLESFGDEDNDQTKLFFHAYRSYCKENGRKVKYSKDKFRDILSKVRHSEFINLTKILTESMREIQTIKQNAESELKKKSAEMT